jgi:hypothetical protein
MMGWKPLEKARKRRENNINTDLREINSEALKWMDIAQDRVQFWTLVSVVLNLHVQTSSGAHPVSYPHGSAGSFPGVKAAGV